MSQSSPYLFGAHVYRAPCHDLGAVIADMRTMRKMGMNLANIQTHWSWDNPRPGVYDFSETDALVSAAREIGLQVSLTLTLEQAPMWAWLRHPGARMLNAWNETMDDPTQYTMPIDGKPGPCWDHAGMRGEAEAYLREFVAHFAPQEHLVYWNVWQEIGTWASRPGDSWQQAMVPFNPETIAKFRSAMVTKYGSLDAINRAWRTRFGSVDEIDPPRIRLAVPSFPDWMRHIHDGYLGDAVAWKVEAVRSADPRHRPVAFHVAVPMTGTTCEYSWSKCADSYGTSYYPTAMRGDWECPEPMDMKSHREYELWSGLFQMVYSRDACERQRRFMMHELAAGPYNTDSGLRAPVTPADMQQWLAMQLAVGSTGTVLWNTRPEHFWSEGQGQGFLDGNGGLTDRCASISAFARAAASHGEAMALAQRPLSPVVIGLDDDTARVAQGSSLDGVLGLSLRGAFKAVLPYDPEFVDLHTASLQGHKVVIVPFPLVMSAQVLEKLSAFAESGGTVILGGSIGRYDPHGMATLTTMPDALAAFLGVKHASMRMVAEQKGQSRWTQRRVRPGDLLPACRLKGTGVLKGLSLVPAMYLQAVTPAGASPIATAGKDVIATTRKVGRGRIVFIGTLFGPAISVERCEDTIEALGRIISEAGVSADQQGRIFRWRRGTADAEVWSLVNFGRARQKWRLDRKVDDVQSGKSLPAGTTITLDPFEVRQLIAPVAEPRAAKRITQRRRR